MALQYRCPNERRRAQILVYNAGASKLQAIDYVEVLDARDGIATEAAQHTILVVGVVAWSDYASTPITTRQVSISGGTRIDTVVVQYVVPLDQFDEYDSTVLETFHADEIAYLAAMRTADSPPGSDPANANVLVVRVSEPGDFSNYTLTFSEVVPATNYKLDPILGVVTFSFKAGCPTPLDCDPPAAACAETAEVTPAIDYLSRDAASFRQLMFDRMAVVLPEWTERSPADLGVTLIELVAYVADHLAYHQDAVGAEAYLRTARKRVSVRRHARLLDYRMHDGCNARAWLTAEVVDDVVIAEHAMFLTELSGFNVKIPADEFAAALLLSPEVFEAVHEANFYPDRNAISLYTWWDIDCCLPKGATSATVTLPNPTTADAPVAGDVLVLVEVISPVTASAYDADPAHRQAVRITAVEEVEEPLPDPDAPARTYYNITWSDDDALTFPARLGSAGTNFVFHGNVVLVDHGRTLRDASLVPATVTASRYRPRLPDTGVTFAVPYVKSTAEAEAASITLAQDPTEAAAAVTLTHGDETWRPQRDLLSSDAFAREFVVETEDDGNAWLRFGDGVAGAEPPEGQVLAAEWRQGNGASGNVGANAIYHVVEDGVVASTGLGNITALHNPLPATGGIEPETLADVRRFAPQAFRTQRRAVTAADYETMLAKHPEVQKAKARLRFTGSWKTMYVAVDRRGDAEVDADFLDGIAAYLEPFRMMGVDLELRPPQYVGLDILLSVCVDDDYSQSEVMESLLNVFSSRDNPDGTRGFFHPDEFSFGDPLYLSKIVAAAMKVDGVMHVFTPAAIPELAAAKGGTEDQYLRFRRWGLADMGESEAGYFMMGTYEILQVANDTTDPERGVIQFNLLGGR